MFKPHAVISYHMQATMDILLNKPARPSTLRNQRQELRSGCTCLQGYMGTLVVGDLNCPPDSLEMHIFQVLLPDLHDCWLQQHPDQPGYTANAADNTFTKPGKLGCCSVEC